MSKANSKSGKTRAVIIGAVAAVVIIAALVAVIVGLMNKKPEPAAVRETTEARGTVVTSENIDEVREEFAKPVEDGYYVTRMNVEWSFATSRTPSVNAYVANPSSNKRTVYFDVTLKDTEELVYSSPFIPVGAELKDFALDADLKAGTYPAVVTYHLVDDDENELTTVSVTVTLYIGHS